MTPAIALNDLSKHYRSVRAVSDLSLTVDQGEAVCLLGPNGAGKSTTLNLILGLSRPNAGTVSVFGHAPHTRAARRVVGYVAQDSDFPPNLTAREVLQLVRCHYSDPVPLDVLIGTFGLDSLADRQTGGFSGGQRRKLSLALAFAGRGQLVVLDEPTTGLDSAARRNFWLYVSTYVEDGGTVLMTTHHLEEIESTADRICLIDDGQIRLQGTVREIRSRIGQKHLHFVCQDPPDLSPVTHIHKDGDKIAMVSPDADEVVRQLVCSGADFSGLEIKAASLEEAIEYLASDAPS